MKNPSIESSNNLKELMQLEKEIELRDMVFDKYRKNDKSLWYGIGGGLIASISIFSIVRYLPSGILLTKELVALVKILNEHIRQPTNTTQVETKLTVTAPSQQTCIISQTPVREDQKQFISTPSISSIQNTFFWTELKNPVTIRPTANPHATSSSLYFADPANQYRFYNAVLNLAQRLNSSRGNSLPRIQNISVGSPTQQILMYS